eukprot:1157074-Pelagomonas_calceolata.AAC.1
MAPPRGTHCITCFENNKCAITVIQHDSRQGVAKIAPGRMVTHSTFLQEEWPEDEDIQARIKADFCSDPDVGDRRQELVFIGQNLKAGSVNLLGEALASLLVRGLSLMHAAGPGLRSLLF